MPNGLTFWGFVDALSLAAAVALGWRLMNGLIDMAVSALGRRSKS